MVHNSKQGATGNYNAWPTISLNLDFTARGKLGTDTLSEYAAAALRNAL